MHAHCDSLVEVGIQNNNSLEGASNPLTLVGTPSVVTSQDKEQEFACIPSSGPGAVQIHICILSGRSSGGRSALQIILPIGCISKQDTFHKLRTYRFSGSPTRAKEPCACTL